jgi:hypothetical protein
MKLAIVGSTRLAGNETALVIIETVITIYNADAIVSGGAPGIDSMAEAACLAHGLEPRIYRPQHKRWWGEGGFKERNEKIAQDCDRLVRIYSSLSTTFGSGWTKQRAEQLGKPTEEYRIEEAPCTDA